MPKFVIYEVWTRHSLVDAPDVDTALRNSDPKPIRGLNLSNWHAVEVPPEPSGATSAKTLNELHQAASALAQRTGYTATRPATPTAKHALRQPVHQPLHQPLRQSER